MSPISCFRNSEMSSWSPFAVEPCSSVLADVVMFWETIGEEDTELLCSICVVLAILMQDLCQNFSVKISPDSFCKHKSKWLFVLRIFTVATITWRDANVSNYDYAMYTRLPLRHPRTQNLCVLAIRRATRQIFIWRFSHKQISESRPWDTRMPKRGILRIW